jgi:hypothetical protein
MLSGGGGEGHRSRGNPLIDLGRNAATKPEGSPRQLNYLRKSGEHSMSVNVLYQTFYPRHGWSLWPRFWGFIFSK